MLQAQAVAPSGSQQSHSQSRPQAFHRFSAPVEPASSNSTLGLDLDMSFGYRFPDHLAGQHLRHNSFIPGVAGKSIAILPTMDRVTHLEGYQEHRTQHSISCLQRPTASPTSVVWISGLRFSNTHLNHQRHSPPLARTLSTSSFRTSPRQRHKTWEGLTSTSALLLQSATSPFSRARTLSKRTMSFITLRMSGNCIFCLEGTL